MADSTRNRSAERLIDILVELQNYGVVSRHNLMKKYNNTERTAYRDLNMLSPFIEACGDGKYRLISARAGNQSKESLHKSLARLLDTDAIFPERDEGFWQKLENRATEKHIRVQFHNPEHTMEGANKQVISSQADSLIKISRIWADFFPANTSNQPI